MLMGIKTVRVSARDSQLPNLEVQRKKTKKVVFILIALKSHLFRQHNSRHLTETSEYLLMSRAAAQMLLGLG